MLIDLSDWHTQFYEKTLFAIQLWYKIYDWKITIVRIGGCICSIKKKLIVLFESSQDCFIIFLLKFPLLFNILIILIYIRISRCSNFLYNMYQNVFWCKSTLVIIKYLVYFNLLVKYTIFSKDLVVKNR